jgi:hypothetical protein
MGTILKLSRVPESEVIDWPVTDQYRKGNKESSPIIWDSLRTSKHRVAWAPPRHFRTFTLERVLKEVSKNEGNLFFRKVAALSDEEAEELSAVIAGPPEPPRTTGSASSREEVKRGSRTGLRSRGRQCGENGDCQC